MTSITANQVVIILIFPQKRFDILGKLFPKKKICIKLKSNPIRTCVFSGWKWMSPYSEYSLYS